MLSGIKSNMKTIQVKSVNGTALFNKCWIPKFYFYLETSDGENTNNLYLNVVHFFNTSVNQISVAA